MGADHQSTTLNVEVASPTCGDWRHHHTHLPTRHTNEHNQHRKHLPTHLLRLSSAPPWGPQLAGQREGSKHTRSAPQDHTPPGPKRTYPMNPSARASRDGFQLLWCACGGRAEVVSGWDDCRGGPRIDI